MKSFDAVIIGAGPSGSATAIGLARRGYEVALIDKQNFPREKLCGDFINPINWDVFADLGVTDRVLAAPHGEVTGFRITDCSGREAEARFRSRNCEWSMGLGLRRATLDQLLVERAAELGVVTHLGCRIEKLSRSADGWHLKIKEENCQAKVLIGADGRNSWVAQQLGLNRSAAIQGRSVGFQTRLRSTGMVDGQIHIHLFPGGYAGVVELGDGTITLGMAIDKRWLGRERGSDFVFHALARNTHLKKIIDASDGAAELSSVYPVYFSKRRCVSDHALLVGDAARVSEPITGQGIYFAMRSGLLAAETIDVALRQKNFAVDILAGYERACRRAFRSRFALNSVLRLAVYRPALVNPLIRLFAKNERLLDSLVATVCIP